MVSEDETFSNWNVVLEHWSFLNIEKYNIKQNNQDIFPKQQLSNPMFDGIIESPYYKSRI